MKYLKKSVALAMLILLTSFVWKPIVGSILLKYIGKCKTAEITNNMTGGRYSHYKLVYRFNIKEEIFEGNSNIKDKSKVGEEICITYLEFMPNINRPLSYYDNPVNCTCK